MANKNPNPKGRWKKGQSGNPKGTVPLPPEIKRINKLSAQELEEIVSLLLNSSQQELKAIQENVDAPFVQRVLVNILFKAFTSGNMSQLDMVLNRVVGKVKDKVDVTVKKPMILERTNGSQVVFTSGEEE